MRGALEQTGVDEHKIERTAAAVRSQGAEAKSPANTELLSGVTALRRGLRSDFSSPL